MEEKQVVAEYIFDWCPYHHQLSEAQVAVSEQVRDTECELDEGVCPAPRWDPACDQVVASVRGDEAWWIEKLEEGEDDEEDVDGDDVPAHAHGVRRGDER